MVYLTLCLWEEIGLVWPGWLSMGRNWSSLAWMNTTTWMTTTLCLWEEIGWLLTLCLWEEIGLVWPGWGVFNVMSMGRNWSSLAWMTTTKIPSTEQDGIFNVMSMGRNRSSLAWMTTVKIPPTNQMVYSTLCLWEEIGLIWPGWLLHRTRWCI